MNVHPTLLASMYALTQLSLDAQRRDACRTNDGERIARINRLATWYRDLRAHYCVWGPAYYARIDAARMLARLGANA